MTCDLSKCLGEERTGELFISVIPAISPAVVFAGIYSAHHLSHLFPCHEEVHSVTYTVLRLHIFAVAI